MKQSEFENLPKSDIWRMYQDERLENYELKKIIKDHKLLFSELKKKTKEIENQIKELIYFEEI